MENFSVKYMGFNGLRYYIQISFKDKFSCADFSAKLRLLYNHKPIRYDNGRFTGDLKVEDTELDTAVSITFLLVDGNLKEASELAHKDLATQFINTQLMLD